MKSNDIWGQPFSYPRTYRRNIPQRKYIGNMDRSLAGIHKYLHFDKDWS